MITFSEVILSFGVIYVTSFLLGFSLLNLACSSINRLPFSVKIPLYMSFGLICYMIFIHIISFIVIMEEIFIGIALISIILSLYQIGKIGVKKIFTIRSIMNELSPLILLFITFMHFSAIISYFKWPPPGDLINHGLFVSILIYNKRLTPTLAPYSSNVPSFPRIGCFHTFSAALALVMKLFPGEAVFIVGGAIASLLPPIIYSLTYINTRSEVLSLLAFLSVFLVGPDLETWPLGYFYNGPYPNLLGFLTILTLITLSSIFFNKGTSCKRSNFFLLLLIIIGTALGYPNFIIHTFYLAFLYKKKIITIIINTFKSKHKLFTFFTIMTLVFLLIYCFRSVIDLMLKGLYFYGSKLIGRPGYAVKMSIFYHEIGIIVLIAGVISLIFIAKRMYIPLAVPYLFILIPILLSMLPYPYVYTILSILLPRRSIMLCALISWSIIFAFLNILLLSSNIKQRTIAIICILLILISYKSSISSLFDGSIAYRYKWLMRHGFSNDYALLLWIHFNVKPDELIMNDYSFTSLYLQSFSFKNVTAKIPFLTKYEEERAKETQKFWQNPSNITHLKWLIDKYNISYILVTSEKMYLNWIGIGGNNKYMTKPHSPSEYIKYLNTASFVELVFRKNEAAIYKVVKN